MGVVGSPSLNGPILHGMSHDVGNAGVQLSAVFDGLFQLPIYVLWQAIPHNPIVEYIPAEHFNYL